MPVASSPLQDVSPIVQFHHILPKGPDYLNPRASNLFTASSTPFMPERTAHVAGRSPSHSLESPSHFISTHSPPLLNLSPNLNQSAQLSPSDQQGQRSAQFYDLRESTRRQSIQGFDISGQGITASHYMWSSREQTYVPLIDEKTLYTSSMQYILILTYMRSGSSFTGDILQHHPQAFYVFEPLITLFHDKTLTYLNGTRRNFTTAHDIELEGVKVIDRWYNCDLYNIDIKSFKSIFMSFGIHTNKFYTCVGKRKSKDQMLKCLPGLIKTCKESKIRVIKTIRLSILSVSPFLEKYKHFKVIHLVRDPRGTMNSRMHVQPKVYTKSKLKLFARDLCQLIVQDLNQTKKLIQNYPKRIAVLKYEELAENPYTTAAKLYGFMETLPSLEIYGYIYCITSMGGVAERSYDIKRGNSTNTANKWKTSLSLSEIKLIDSVCKSEYVHLGYLPLSNPEELKFNVTRIKISEEIKGA